MIGPTKKPLSSETFRLTKKNKRKFKLHRKAEAYALKACDSFIEVLASIK